jgi:hypothetical protein
LRFVVHLLSHRLSHLVRISADLIGKIILNRLPDQSISSTSAVASATSPSYSLAFSNQREFVALADTNITAMTRAAHADCGQLEWIVRSRGG